jgi:hypothetical protein
VGTIPGEAIAAAMRLKSNEPRVGTDSARASAQPQTRSPGLAPIYFDECVRFEPELTALMCERCGRLRYFGACMQCDAEEPPATVHTYDGRESLWWLSYADDHRCAGVAIVRVTGEQSAKHAADVARARGLTPAGEWQVMGIQVPEEERALAERFAGRFLTITEAESAFAAQSIKSFEAQNPDVSLDFCPMQIVEADG